MTKWHFVTFAAGKNFEEAAKRLSAQAKKSRYFETITTITPQDLYLNREFWSQHKNFFDAYSNGRGYALWLWKPEVIQMILRKIENGDGVLYLDAGSYLNLSRKKSKMRFIEYLKEAETHGSLAFEVGDNCIERYFSHPKLLGEIGLKELDIASPQVEASCLFVIKSIENMKFLEQWQEWLRKEKYFFLLKSEFTIDGVPCNGREDQSILSALYKKHNKYVLSNETYFEPNWRRNGKHFPIWHTRRRAGGRIPKSRMESRVLDIRNQAMGFAAKALKQYYFAKRLK